MSAVKMMKAVRFHRQGGPEVLQYEDVQRPVAGEGHVVVQTRATGINFADTIRRSGGSYPVKTELPYLLGGEAVGDVVEVGEGVDGAILGQRVLVFPGEGSYAEFVAAPQDRVYQIPDQLSDDHALALFVQGLTASFILRHHLRPRPQETLLIQAAAGGVGSLAVQLARDYDVGRVIGCVSNDEKAEVVRGLGADVAVNYTLENWQQKVRDFTEGRGVDAVFEVTGGRVAEASYDLLAPFGRICVFGMTSDQTWTLDTQKLPGKCATVSGFWLKPYLSDKSAVEAELRQLSDMVLEGRLTVNVGGRYLLSDAGRAHRDLEERRTTGKLILVPKMV